MIVIVLKTLSVGYVVFTVLAIPFLATSERPLAARVRTKLHIP